MTGKGGHLAPCLPVCAPPPHTPRIPQGPSQFCMAGIWGLAEARPAAGPKPTSAEGTWILRNVLWSGLRCVSASAERPGPPSPCRAGRLCSGVQPRAFSTQSHKACGNVGLVGRWPLPRPGDSWFNDLRQVPSPLGLSFSIPYRRHQQHGLRCLLKNKVVEFHGRPQNHTLQVTRKLNFKTPLF